MYNNKVDHTQNHKNETTSKTTKQKIRILKPAIRTGTLFKPELDMLKPTKYIGSQSYLNQEEEFDVDFVL